MSAGRSPEVTRAAAAAPAAAGGGAQQALYDVAWQCHPFLRSEPSSPAALATHLGAPPLVLAATAAAAAAAVLTPRGSAVAAFSSALQLAQGDALAPLDALTAGAQPVPCGPPGAATTAEAARGGAVQV